MYDLYMKWKRNLELAAEELNINMDCVWFGLKTEGLFLTESVVYLILFAWFGYLLSGLIFLAGFSFLRVYCGGYHCSSRLSCFLSGLCICLSVCVLETYIPLHILQVLMIVSIVYLCVVCPAENDRYHSVRKMTVQSKCIAAVKNLNRLKVQGRIEIQVWLYPR